MTNFYHLPIYFDSNKAKAYRHNDQLADILHYLTAGIPHLFVILLPLWYGGGNIHIFSNVPVNCFRMFIEAQNNKATICSVCSPEMNCRFYINSYSKSKIE